MKVFVEFVGRGMLVDLKLSQNPYMPTTFGARFYISDGFFSFSFFLVTKDLPVLLYCMPFYFILAPLL